MRELVEAIDAHVENPDLEVTSDLNAPTTRRPNEHLPRTPRDS